MTRTIGVDIVLMSLAMVVQLGGGCTLPPVIAGEWNGDPSTSADSSTAMEPEPGDSTSGSILDDDGTGPSGPAVCGNGWIEDPEECDLGPANGFGEYCTPQCQANRCGDGYRGPGEACDDGNTVNDDQCTNQCALSTCGDGIVQAAEECDDGRGNGVGAVCLPNCRVASCGDLEILRGEEICDGLNLAGATCESENFDGGTLGCADDCASLDTSGCRRCGNGIAEVGEICDGLSFYGGVTCDDYAPFGQTASGGGLLCSPNCMVLSIAECDFCGNGFREGAEVCDTDDFDRITCQDYAPFGQTASGGSLECINFCTAISSTGCTYCGDGRRQDPEDCDGLDLDGQTCSGLGLGDGSLGCASSCTFETSGCTAL